MSIRWVGATSLVGLFSVFVVLPTALVCGPSWQLLVAFILGAVVSYLLFAATEHHEDVQPTLEDYHVSTGNLDSQVSAYKTLKRKKAIGAAALAVVTWIPYVITLLSLGWTGWWWILPLVFFVISLVIVLDLAGTVLWDG